MHSRFGISWGGGRCAHAVALALAVLGAMVLPSPATGRAPAPLVPVIVRAEPGAADAVAAFVSRLGGTIGQRLSVIDGMAARVPAVAVDTLRHLPDVAAVTPDAKVQLLGTGHYDAAADGYSMVNTTLATGARAFWAEGYTGQGVDVALIDSGVAPVDGIDGRGKVIEGPDLSFESQSPRLADLDTYGHGTHMAGIIAGRDDHVRPGSEAGNSQDFLGMAPDARIVSIKVADANGATDVSQMLAAIDWVVQHRDTDGLHIGVLNLSFGTDSTQDYLVDPLAYAAEVAWHKGIVVVAAAGNAGHADGSRAPGLADPAYDPYVLAVGAADTNGTVTPMDDSVADFSSGSRGHRDRSPDLVAPGRSIASLRVPGSHADDDFGATATVGTRYFRGSGTSQAAAVVSGAAALILSQRPTATPDEVKSLLTSTAVAIPGVAASAQGSGELDLRRALHGLPPNQPQNWRQSNGSGSLERARGSYHVTDQDGVTLKGERDIFGRPVRTKLLARELWTESAWDGGDWNGSTWTGDRFVGPLWSKGHSWSGVDWSGHSWSGHSWSDQQWGGHSWSGHSWSGVSWEGHSWSGHSWSDNAWTDGDWS